MPGLHFVTYRPPASLTLRVPPRSGGTCPIDRTSHLSGDLRSACTDGQSTFPHSVRDRRQVRPDSPGTPWHRKEDPAFPQRVEAALDHRPLMRELAETRIAADLSQTKLAAAAGTSQSQIARAESGDVDVRLSTVARMAAVLGKRLEWNLVDAN